MRLTYPAVKQPQGSVHVADGSYGGAGISALKFVVGDKFDLVRAEEIIKEYGLTDRCRVYLSPVFGKIKPEEIAEFMKERKLNGVRLQLQLHKIIWEPDMRGV